MTDWALGIASRQVVMRRDGYSWTATLVRHHAVPPSPTIGPPIFRAVCGEIVDTLPLVFGVQSAFDPGTDYAHRACVALIRGGAPPPEPIPPSSP